MFNKKLLVGLAFAMALSLTSTNGFAAAPTTGVDAPDNVTIETFVTANFTSLTLNGLIQTTTSAITDMTVVDARGTGAGWSVNISATQFTSNSNQNTSLKTLPLDSLLLGTVSIVADANATPVTGVAAVAYSAGPPAVDTVTAVAATTIATGTLDKVGGVKILNVPLNGGMGTYVVSIAAMTLTLLPKHAKKGTYNSTITLTLSQGPVG